MAAPLPIDDILETLIATLARDRRAVLQAPPGAGKTTRVPLAMMQAGLTGGRIVMLEPRRLAARAAAERMAAGLGEPVGQSIGYRIRGEAKVSGATRIEVVTEGILTRMLQSDPDLPGIGAVIFDEFHERSLNADLGLALCLEVAGALRDDLILLAMSATLDAGPVGALMGAQVLTSEGRSYPVETIWAERPLGAGARMEPALCDLVLRAEEETRGTGGGLLVFLPGEAEIRRVEAGLRARLPGDCVLRPLYGAMPFAEQRAAIAPLEGVGRKVVLSTSIAETSLTIEDIRVVVDAGHVATDHRESEPSGGDAAAGPRRAGGGGTLLSALDEGRAWRPARLSACRDRGGGPCRAGAGPRALGKRRPALPHAAARPGPGRGAGTAADAGRAGCARPDHRAWQGAGGAAAASAARSHAGPCRTRRRAAGRIDRGARPTPRRARRSWTAAGGAA
jgi:hypothetical protein